MRQGAGTRALRSRFLLHRPVLQQRAAAAGLFLSSSLFLLNFPPPGNLQEASCFAQAAEAPPQRKYHVFVRGGATHGVGPMICKAAQLAADNVGNEHVILFLHDETPECTGIGTQFVGKDCNPASILSVLRGIQCSGSKPTIDTDSAGGFSITLTIFSHGNPGSMDPHDPMRAAADNQRWLVAEFHDPPETGPGAEILQNSPAARTQTIEAMGGKAVFKDAIHWEEIMETTRFLVEVKGAQGIFFNFKFCYSGGFLKWITDPVYHDQSDSWPVFAISSSDAFTYSFGDSISPDIVYRQALDLLTATGMPSDSPSMDEFFSILKTNFLDMRKANIERLGPTQQREAQDPAITDPAGYIPLGVGTSRGSEMPLNLFFNVDNCLPRPVSRL
eukprot:TRINITY_DN29681_c0_g2_i1.p1 TRINITY_DN29681_c0_g2~~TRINITY_DN29681_c0_g2_i1.p1  ORF type:complete len:388 (-),score=63.55 TRINITY_DN29681_c0_g2_i1:104-1267(-)